ncbi:hypothetical protein KM043_008678 [Ampulex compressa]|nr:hypothetical protein KM043_008678 [Ampulex compressa]
MSFIEDHILAGVVTLLWLLYLWKLYLNLRQRALMQRLVDIPDIVNGFMSKDVYDKSRMYAIDRNSFSIAKDLCSMIFTMIFLLSYLYYYFWEWSIQLAVYFGLNRENEILISAICMFIINVVSDTLNLPLNIYYTFWVEEKHGFNKQKPLFFAKDQLLYFVVSQVIGLPVLCAVIWIIQNCGDYFFLYLWVFSVIITLFLMIIYPEVIAPLFDKYSPLPEGDLKEKIEALAASMKFPLYKIFIVEGSKRSSHSNAYFYGLWKYKRIVLFDTLVKEYYKPSDGDANKNHGCETDEVLAILAHELGHWKYNHLLKGSILAQVNFVMHFLLYAKLLYYKSMYVAFGFTNAQPTFIGLIIVTMFILIPLSTIMQYITVVIGRKYEFEADRFAKLTGRAEPLKRALIKLEEDNLTYPVYDKLYSSWYHNHPPVPERLEALDKED